MEIKKILLTVFLLFGLGSSQSFQPCDLGKYVFLHSFMIMEFFNIIGSNFKSSE